MDLTQLYNDPATQMLADRSGLSVQDYVSQMDPRAVQANLANINRGPALYTNPDQYTNMLATGANSPLAFIPEQGNPANEGVLFNPTIGQPPQADGPPRVPTAISGGPTQREAPTLAQPPVMAQPPAPQEAPILASSGMGATQGALSNSGAGAAVVSRPNSGPSSGSRQTPTNNTANARNSGMPDMRIGRSEALGRIGTAMLGGNKTGLMDAMAAGGNAMYATSDANREADLAEYENSERLRLEKVKEAQVAAALAARGGGGAGKGKEATLAAASAIKLRDVDAALQGLDDYDGVVGMGYWFNVGWDKITDSQRATIRQKIARVKVDATLANTALTKGAISDREMAIFQSDQPAWTDGENAWRSWLTEYRNALMIMNTNLATGASPYLQGNNSGGGGSTAAPTSSANSDALSAADAILGIGG